MERWRCAICLQFHSVDWDAKTSNHFPQRPDRVAEYWKSRSKTFKEILKGDTKDNGKRETERAEQQRSLGFI